MWIQLVVDSSEMRSLQPNIWTILAITAFSPKNTTSILPTAQPKSYRSTMADVRALLRAERAARAPPSKARKHDAPTAVLTKKRKAIDDDDTEETRKRSRPQSDNENLPAGFFDATEDVEEGPQAPIDGFVPAEDEDPGVQKRDTLQEDIAKTEAAVNSARPNVIPPPPEAADINEDEWAAFQAFTSAVPTKPPSALDALKTSAVLEAAPQTTEQAAQQARETVRLDTKSKREEEIEDEKEEAAEKLELDFEIQGELDERVRRLKEKREALRRASLEGGRPPAAAVVEVEMPEAVMEEESSDGEEVDDFDAWRFGAR